MDYGGTCKLRYAWEVGSPVQLNKTANEARSESPHTAALAQQPVREGASRRVEAMHELPDPFIEGLQSGERERLISEPPADALENRSPLHVWLTGALCLLAGFFTVRFTAGPVEAEEDSRPSQAIAAHRERAADREVAGDAKTVSGKIAPAQARSDANHEGTGQVPAASDVSVAEAPSEAHPEKAQLTAGAQGPAALAVFEPLAFSASKVGPPSSHTGFSVLVSSGDMSAVAGPAATVEQGLAPSEVAPPNDVAPPSHLAPASTPSAAVPGSTARPMSQTSAAPVAANLPARPASSGPRVLPPEAPLPAGGPPVAMGRVAYIRCGEGDPAAMHCKRDIPLELRMMNVLQRLPHCEGAPQEIGHGDLRMEFRDGLLHNAWMKNVRRRPAISGKAWMSCARQVTQGLVTRLEASPLVISFRFEIQKPE